MVIIIYTGISILLNDFLIIFLKNSIEETYDETAIIAGSE